MILPAKRASRQMLTATVNVLTSECSSCTFAKFDLDLYCSLLKNTFVLLFLAVLGDIDQEQLAMTNYEQE